MVDVIEPFDTTGVVRGPDGGKRFVSLLPSVVAMLRASTDQAPAAEAFVELDGPRLTYAQLWDGAAKVAGGLRAAGVRRGNRVAIRHGNGLDWALSFFGTVLAGGVAVPVNTRFTEPEVDYVLNDSGAALVLAPGNALPEGAPLPTKRLRLMTSQRSSTRRGRPGFPKVR